MSASIYQKRSKVGNKFTPVLHRRKGNDAIGEQNKKSKSGSQLQILKVADRLKDKIKFTVRIF